MRSALPLSITFSEKGALVETSCLVMPKGKKGGGKEEKGGTGADRHAHLHRTRCITDRPKGS